MNNQNLEIQQERLNFNLFKDWVFPRIFCLSIPIIVFGLLTIFLIVQYCSEPECKITTLFNPIVITFILTVILIEVFMMLLYFICFFQSRILNEVYILHKKIEDAEIYITVLILLTVPIVVVLAKECSEQFQIRFFYIFLSSITLSIWILHCFPRNTYYYFNGEYL